MTYIVEVSYDDELIEKIECQSLEEAQGDAVHAERAYPEASISIYKVE